MRSYEALVEWPGGEWTYELVPARSEREAQDELEAEGAKVVSIREEEEGA